MSGRPALSFCLTWIGYPWRRVGRVFESHHIVGKTLVGLEDSAHPTPALGHGPDREDAAVDAHVADLGLVRDAARAR